MKIYSGNKVGIFSIDYEKVFYKFPLPGMNKMTLGQKPPMKGGHTHNHKINAYHRKKERQKCIRKYIKRHHILRDYITAMLKSQQDYDHAYKGYANLFKRTKGITVEKWGRIAYSNNYKSLNRLPMKTYGAQRKK